jgi:hypothetical protein
VKPVLLFVLGFAALAHASHASAQAARLESATGQGGADCYEQIRKARPPEFDPRRGLVGGVDNSDLSETSVVLVRLVFRQANEAPLVEVAYAAGNPKLVPIVERAVSEYRLTCLPQGEQVVEMQKFIMHGLDAPVPQLKRDLALIDVVRLIKDIQNTRVRFDFSTMACPFQVGFAPYRPYARNTVKEVGIPDANRREFIEWLKDITLDLPPKFMRTAMGESSVVTVPCTVLDLS